MLCYNFQHANDDDSFVFLPFVPFLLLLLIISLPLCLLVCPSVFLCLCLSFFLSLSLSLPLSFSFFLLSFWPFHLQGVICSSMVSACKWWWAFGLYPTPSFLFYLPNYRPFPSYVYLYLFLSLSSHFTPSSFERNNCLAIIFGTQMMMTHLSVESLLDVTNGAEEELIASFFNEDVHRAHWGEIEGGCEAVARNECVNIR